MAIYIYIYIYTYQNGVTYCAFKIMNMRITYFLLIKITNCYVLKWKHKACALFFCMHD